MKTNTITGQSGVSQVALITVIGILCTILAAGGGYMVRNNSANEEIEELKTEVSRLEKKTSTADPGLGLSGQEPPSQQGQAAQSTTFSNANVGFSVDVPAEWAGQWKYQESSNIGIAAAAVEFYLINKDTKYQSVVTIGKIPQLKYDEAKASGSAVGNADNLLQSAGGFAYVMIFADNAQGDYKNFTYAQATKAAREKFKATFKLL